MTKANQEYLLKNNLPEADLAKATGLSVKTVKAFLKKNPRPVVEAPKPLTEETGKVKLGKYIVQDGSVIMTPGQSTTDDMQRAQNEPGKPKFNNDLVPVVLKNKTLVPKEE